MPNFKAALFWVTIIIAVIGVYIFLGYEDADLEIVNQAPYKVKVAFSHPKSKNTWHTKGWINISPGEKVIVKNSFYRTNPSYFVTTESNDQTIVAYMHDIQPEKATLKLNKPEIIRTVSQYNMDYIEKDNQLKSGVGQTGYAKALYIGGGKTKTFRYIVQDDLKKYSNNNDSDVWDACLDAKNLSESLRRQIIIQENWEGKLFPFYLGVDLYDPNKLSLGIKVGNTSSLTRDGKIMPFQTADEIVKLNGVPTYSKHDIMSVLLAHGTDKSRGVKVPVTYTIIRNNHEYHGDVTYYFNKDLLGKSEDQAIAGWLGFVDGISFGNAPVAGAILIKGLGTAANTLNWLAGEEKRIDTPPIADIVWGITQKMAMVKQFETDSFQVGEVGSLFIRPTKMLIPRWERTNQVFKQTNHGVNEFGGTSLNLPKKNSFPVLQRWTPIYQNLPKDNPQTNLLYKKMIIKSLKDTTGKTPHTNNFYWDRTKAIEWGVNDFGKDRKLPDAPSDSSELPEGL